MIDYHLFNGLKTISGSDQQLRQHILWLLLIRIILFTLLIGVTLFLQAKGHFVILPPPSLTIAFLSVLFIYSIGAAGILQIKSLRVRRFGISQLLSDTVFAAALIYGTGCSQSIFTPILIFPVLAAGLILFRIGGLFLAATATLLYGAVLTCEYFAFLPGYFADTPYVFPKDPLTGTNLFAIYGLTFFLVALISGFLASRLRITEKQLSRTSLEFDRLSLLYKQIFDDINTGIITTDEQDIINSYNFAAERITGYPADEVLGRKMNVRFPEMSLTEQQDRQVVDLYKKNNDRIRVGYSFSRLNMPVDPTIDVNVTTSAKVITLQDISKIEEMEKKIRQAEKMAAIGELSASIAHDFRNPLAAISGSAQIMDLNQEAGSVGTEEENHTLTTIILRESERMGKTINEFLQFARPAPLNCEWFDLRRFIEESIGPIAVAMEHYPHCDVQLDIPTSLDCYADRQQLQTVLTQLLENSCQATSTTDKPLVIKAQEEEQNENHVIRIDIMDQGVGIADEIKGEVFTPFFTTRENGTGLGLAIVQQILEQHGGSVDITSGENGGCTATLYLPLPELSIPSFS